jgi:putative hemolysin
MLVWGKSVMDAAFVVVPVIAVFVFANALYVMAEFATINARRSRVVQQAAAGNRFAQLLEPVITDTGRLDVYVTVCQMGMSLASLLLGFYTQSVIAQPLSRWLFELLPPGVGPDWLTILAHILAIVLVAIPLTVVYVVFGELLPRSLGLRYSEEIALPMVVPMRFSMAVLRPAIALLHAITVMVFRLVGVPPPARRQILSPEEIEMVAVESVRGGMLEANEHELLHNVFRIGELTASKVMVPRTRVVAAPVATPLMELLELVTRSGHTRIPLYRDTIDTIVGMVHLKDLLRLYVEGNGNVVSVLRNVSYVSESMPALGVWKQLQQERSYVAIVLDEFGGTEGMITIADLIEEIFGELRDEFDDEPSLLVRGLDGGVRLQGDALISDVNGWFDLHLPEDEVNTVGGLVMTVLGRLPQVGDEVALDRVRLRVEAVNGPVVSDVCLYMPLVDEVAPGSGTAEGG